MKKFILDEIDHQILDILIENARTPFTDIAKKLLVSAGTIHVRVKKMEDELRIIHEGGDRDGLCWSKLVEYNYASATSESKESLKDYFRKPLKETVLVDDFILMPVSIHPCMEALINLYGETKEEIFIDRARELNEAMLEKNIKKTSNCDVKGSSILVAGSNENIIHEGHYLADSAYQTYLMTRPGFIDEEITIR